MSTKPKRKPKAKAVRKQKPKVAKRRLPSPTPPPAVKKAERKPIEAKPAKSFMLAIRLRGPVASPEYIEKTLRSLRLEKRFSAVLVEKNPSLLGMLRIAKDYLTWGDMKTQDITALFTERAHLVGGAPLTDKAVKELFGVESIRDLVTALEEGSMNLKALRQKGITSVFRLRAPSGGFVYNIKRPVSSRGELGNRGEQISHLVARMI